MVTRNSLSNAAAMPETAAPVFRRIAAFMCDYLFILLYLGLLVLAQSVFPAIRGWFLDASIAHPASFSLVTLPVAAYFAVSEASGAKATFGKRIMHIQVVSNNGERLTVGASVIRAVVKFIPWELGHCAVWRFRFASGDPGQYRNAKLFLAFVWILLAAYLISMALDKRRRTPYDFAAGSWVVGPVPSTK